MRVLRWLLDVGAVLLTPLALGVTAAWLAWGLSLYTGALGCGLSLLAVALLGWAGRWSRARVCLMLALALCAGPLLTRVLTARGTAEVQLTLLPGDRGTRLVDRLLPEPDGTLAAAGAIELQGGLEDEEGARFREILAQSYARMGERARSLPTPAIATYLGLQSRGAFDAVQIAPPARATPPTGAVIFLHGYAGSFVVYCWELAQAAREAGLLTLCPSVGPSGAWWTPAGEATYRESVRHLRRRGIARIYLAGLSNGAAGASVIAQRHQAELSGLVLISGVRARHPTKLPTLVVQGSRDRMMPAALSRAYASQSKRVQLALLPGGHLIFLSQHARVRALIAAFLRAREQAR